MLHKDQSARKSFLSNQEGFTLIEIIAVLIILGLLAAVAVPKFGALTDEARKKALGEAFAAGRSNISMAYSEYLLKNSGAGANGTNDSNEITGTGGTNVAIPTNLGDFDAAYSGDQSDCTITLTDNDDTPDWFSDIGEDEKSRTFRCPWNNE